MVTGIEDPDFHLEDGELYIDNLLKRHPLPNTITLKQFKTDDAYIEQRKEFGMIVSEEIRRIEREIITSAFAQSQAFRSRNRFIGDGGEFFVKNGNLTVIAYVTKRVTERNHGAALTIVMKHFIIGNLNVVSFVCREVAAAFSRLPSVTAKANNGEVTITFPLHHQEVPVQDLQIQDDQIQPAPVRRPSPTDTLGMLSSTINELQ
jgi:hypothetical protein